jgi:hypothetical protein
VPVFYFLLPIYSFWHMDDFSWGQTRQVNTTIIDDEEANDSIEEEQLFEVSLKSNPGPVSDSGSSLSREDDVALPVSSPLNPIFLLI